jgi:LAO/AO transport system kinase
LDRDALTQAALRGERSAVARLISMVEDGGSDLPVLMEALYGHTGLGYSIGITGAPGAGKSTLTERLVAVARSGGHEVGVLAIDPTSPFSGGALLGDRVRMQNHATDAGVFIRSMATRGHLGGLSLATPEAARVLEAAGKDIIIIETVGVGQAEVEITDACDTTIVVLNPGWGDAVQAAKAGLLEIADIFVVNKADRQGTRDAVRELKQMLEMSELLWKPEIVETVATEGSGVDELWKAVEMHRMYQEENGLLEERRRRRIQREIRDIVVERMRQRLQTHASGLLDSLTEEVIARRLDPYGAADRLLEALQAS